MEQHVWEYYWVYRYQYVLLDIEYDIVVSIFSIHLSLSLFTLLQGQFVDHY